MKIVAVKLTQVCCPAPTTLRWGWRATDTMGGIIVRVLTDEGITGLGEFEAIYPETRAVLESAVLPHIRGENPPHIERLWGILHSAIRGRPRQMLVGIDIALWDILGKVTGQPVYRLLGGNEEPVLVYIAPSMEQPDMIAEECAQFQAKGYRAIKLRIGLGQVGLAELGDMKKDFQIVDDASPQIADPYSYQRACPEGTD